MKTLKKIGVLFLSICLLVQVWGIDAHAASGTVTLSGASGNVGSTVTVSGSITSSSGAIGAADVVILYPTAGLQYVSGSASNGSAFINGGSGSVTYTGSIADGTTTALKFTMKFKILAEGTHTVSVSSADIWNFDYIQLEESRGSAKVTGKVATSSSNNSSSDTPQDTRDSNANLSALQIYPGTLSPAFSAGTTAYTVTVPGETTEVTISATPESSKAKVSVTGGTDLKLGENAAKVVVMAENDSTKVYEITIICGEKEKIEINGTENTINEGFTDDQIPTGFTRTKVTYNGREYEALTNGSGTLKLMSLQNGETAGFYIYNEETQEFQEFAAVQIAAEKYIYLMPLNEENEAFADYEKTQITIQEKVFDAWKLDDEFSVVTALDQNGEEVLYRYDSVDGTFQRYAQIEEVVEEPATKWPDIPLDYLWYAAIGFAALSGILLISMVYFIATRKIRHKARKNRAQKRAEKKAAKEAKIEAKENAKAEKIAGKEAIKAAKIAEKEARIAEKEAIKAEKIAAKEARKEAKRLKKEQ